MALFVRSSVQKCHAFKTTRHQKMHLCYIAKGLRSNLFLHARSRVDRKPFVSEDAKDGLFRIHLFLGLFFLGGGGYLFVPWGYWISRWVLCLWDVHVKQTLRHTGICSVYFYILLYFAYINSIKGGISFLYLKPHIYEVFTLLSNFKWMPARIEV